MIYSLHFTIFCVFYPQNYLGYFVQGQLHLATTQILLWRQGIKLEVLLGFENFQIVAHGFLGCQFLGKYKIFQKKFSGYFAVIEYVLFLDIFAGVLSEYV